jgi:hypothetical protein
MATATRLLKGTGEREEVVMRAAPGFSSGVDPA